MNNLDAILNAGPVTVADLADPATRETKDLGQTIIAAASAGALAWG